jgi:hypothetical protein
LAQSVVPSSGSTERYRLSARIRCDLLADEQHRRLIHLALADHNRAVDRKAAEFVAHGIDGSLVGFLSRAATAQPGGGNCGALSYPRDLKRQGALEAGILTDRL